MELAHTTEDHHHQDGARVMPGENFRVDEAELTRGEIAGHSRQRPAQYEGAELVGENWVADGPHAIFVGLDACQRAAERRAEHLAQERVYPDHEDEHEIIKVNRIFKIDGFETGNADLGSRVNVNAVRPAAEPRVVEY